LALLLVSSDGWLVYTNRLNLIENSMIPIGLAGLWVYAVALRKKRVWYYTLAGVVLGFATIYKHTGIYFLLVPVINWLLIRENGRHHALLLRAAALVVLAYIVGMYLVWGNEYLSQSWVQIQRTYGGMGARGVNYGIGEVIQAIVDRYWIFFTTIICLIAGSVTVMVRLVQYIRKRQPPDHSILLSWSIAAIAFLGIIALRAPHYFIIVLVPLYAFLAAELMPLFRQKTIALATPLLLIVVLALNFVTWHMRFVQRTDNALLATYDYAAQYIPADARVLTEECIGPLLKQPYYKLDTHDREEQLEKVKPTHLILYFSTTQKPPTSQALETLIQRSLLIRRITGFKEEIYIYQVESERGAQEELAEPTPLLLDLAPTEESKESVISLEPTETATATPTPTAMPTETPTATPTSTQSPTPTATSSPTVTATPAPSPTREEKKEVYYVVKEGDWLMKIARQLYSDWRKWRTIYEANRGIIQNPNLIYPDQVLVIPK
jgi:hypothetical protein